MYIFKHDNYYNLFDSTIGTINSMFIGYTFLLFEERCLEFTREMLPHASFIFPYGHNIYFYLFRMKLIILKISQILSE